ncbi:pyrimidine utilization protein D (plasmid) [Rhizobium sp. ACO-34A]|nr:pyrimidine utilization protein D [Rhizobium sp. ACO-34A]ATN36904.1 pyrimidine utilization protein D [Rhizobium sp. ACO-34A]
MYYEVHGRQADDAPTIILSSGLGGAGAYWLPQIDTLAASMCVVIYDHRGTGHTGGALPDSYRIADMADDVLEIADRLKLDRFHFMGHALGGLVGLDLTLRRPELLSSLVLVNAWSKVDPHTERCFDVRLNLLEKAGVAAFLKAQPLFLYPAVWMSENAERLAAEEAHGLVHFQGEHNLLKRISALRAFDIDDRVNEIMTPTLIAATRDDLLVPFTRSQRLAERLANALLTLTDFGGHAVNVTAPDTFNADVLAFLEQHI